MKPALRLLLAMMVATGCARPAGAPVGVTRVPSADPAPPNEPHPAGHPEPPADVVARSALPISGLRVSDGASLGAGELFDELSRFAAVCIGESHDDPHHHYAELELLKELSRRAAFRGEQLGVGFEMFQAPFQGVLDGYVRGSVDEQQLLENTQYAQRWGFPFAFYRPLLEAGRERGLSLLALNARRELTRGVAKRGLNGISPELRDELPELDLENAEHRQRFDGMMAGHPGHGAMDNYYVAQVIWDETMAERSATFLSRGQPAHKLLIVAGLAHCARPAIPERVERRSGARVAAVMPSVGTPASAVGFDYALVLTPAE